MSAYFHSYLCGREAAEWLIFMEKQRVCNFLNRYAPPVLVILGGLILVFNPDSLSVLLSRILGWGLLVVGIGWGILQIIAHAKLSQFLGAAVCILLGLWLVNDPLLLAKSIGRVVGLLLIFRGTHMMTLSDSTLEKVLAILTILFGAIMLLMPMTTSRLAIILMGLTVVIVGITMLIEEIRGGRKRLGSGDDNIIDAL